MLVASFSTNYNHNCGEKTLQSRKLCSPTLNSPNQIFFFSFFIPSGLSYSHYSKKNLSLLQETSHSLTKKCLYLTQTATHSENQHLGSLNHSSSQAFLELLLKQHFNEKMHMFSSRKKNCLRSCGNFSSRSRLSYS